MALMDELAGHLEALAEEPSQLPAPFYRGTDLRWVGDQVGTAANHDGGAEGVSHHNGATPSMAALERTLDDQSAPSKTLLQRMFKGVCVFVSLTMCCFVL